MLFRRRKPADLWERARTFLLPRRSYFRSFRYFIKRVLRLSATPHAVAAGVAAGVFASFTPFVGFHIMIAAILAYLLSGNILASAIGTAIGNPLTFPFIWGATLEAGQYILTGSFIRSSVPGHFHDLLWSLDPALLWVPLLKPMIIGAIPLGLIFAFAFYVLTRWATQVFREQRTKRLAMRAKRRAVKQRIPDAATAGS